MTIYLDNAATSFPKPESVYRAMDQFARTSLANPGRSGHKMALASEHALDNARHRLNQHFHGKGPDRFIFTLNGTDALNLAIKGLLNPGDHVITSELEHNSVSRPLRGLEKAGVISLTKVTADDTGTISPDDVRDAITPKTRLIALTHASNVLGTVQPIEEIGKIAREHNIVFLVDAAQTAGVLPIDVQALHIDLLAFPGHKSLMGPTGTGALYVAPGITLRPWREGGTGGDSVSEVNPTEMPFHLEGGTPNVVGLVGLTAGIDYVEQRGLHTIHQHEVDLVERLWKALDQIPAIQVFGHRNHAKRVGTLSFRSELLPANELGGVLDEAFTIAIRPGLHCAPFVHRGQGSFPEGTIRVSPGAFNTEADIDTLAQALTEIHS
ncbi:aminotransferase class V-fold PLP-dependent enzyme [Tuwongella immobilis]|uniref:cysteine desulfurase n=1 Tax=Tuwongella immobilis TaxID=692036 RepID=A0A6C2YVW7_9BACT|nr:aminotransferase class V-fold PLP-dependent enzyme [Tuwongella immobilis]VIP05770.1 cysteine desulfurase : Cysteine desulfurase family protein OS=Singulisphaera acidiphila (strain ATCC BAA-1392 / DSM 18658 / VKM B-2454 / MOB10) GN=Sinac_6669 PE=3 SV=1: Aminotran_5 [Tuwongella immobilis]VTS08896.1 cysteine desulfurase : Cysteine desulfurase family protein OS=Singulisphaera acidiphila (strain ATCC BAA-1392 / DSM 18658 / VKM B-2454 / MOB10) GN=Sinac_6669 PE=3 SV=1: Aminotran_5 [Tuwongella immobil